MTRNSGATVAAGFFVSLVLLVGIWSLLPRSSREQTIASLRPQAVSRAVPPIITPQTATPTKTPTPTQTPTPTSTPSPTPSPTVTPIPTDAPAAGEFGASLDRYLNNLVEAKLFHGAVLVARNGSVVLSKGYGPADIDKGLANSANTRMRIASMTKQFTSMAVMQLVAQGKLAVDDPVCQYVDDCPERWGDITIRMLLNHTHGLPNYTDFPSYERTQMEQTSVAELLDRLRGQWPVWTPGQTYNYGNSGYVLLGAIIEKVSGQSYGDFLHEHIFTPLGMNNSGVTYAPTPGENWALPYQSFSRLAAPLDTSTLFAAGAVYSTVEDLYRWDQALYTDQILPNTLRTEMFTPGLGRYGFGWKIVNDDGHLRTSHPGKMDGCRSIILRYPEDRVTVIVIANMHDADADGIAAYIARIVLNS